MHFPASLPPGPHSPITGHGPVGTHLYDLGKWGHVFLFFFFFPHLRAIKRKTLYAYIPKVHFSLEDAEVETKRSPDNFSNAA